jgi:hypothetical protein
MNGRVIQSQTRRLVGAGAKRRGDLRGGAKRRAVERRVRVMRATVFERGRRTARRRVAHRCAEQWRRGGRWRWRRRWRRRLVAHLCLLRRRRRRVEQALILRLLLERRVHLVQFALLARLLLVLLHALLELCTRLLVDLLQTLHLVRERVDVVLVLHDALLVAVALERELVVAILAGAALTLVNQIDLIHEKIDCTRCDFQDWKKSAQKHETKTAVCATRQDENSL